MTRSSPSDRRGAALATMLLVLVTLTILITAAAARASNDRGRGDDERAQLAAYAAAQSGLQLASVDLAAQTLSSVGTSWTRSYPGMAGGARADVRLTRIAADGTPAGPLYLLTSTGLVPSGGPDAAVPPAQRSIAMLVTRGTFSFNPSAALISLSGVQSTESDSRIDGNDQCSAGGARPPLAGVAVPTPGGSGQGGFDVTDAATVVRGDPDGVAVALLPWNASAILDWSAVEGSARFGSPYRLRSSGRYFTSGTPPWSARWPTSRRAGSMTLDGSSSTIPNGTLVVTGDLTIDRDWDWEGLLLVGGQLRVLSGREVEIRGQVFTGMRAMLAGPPIAAAQLLGEVDIRYDHCVVDSVSVRQNNGLGLIRASFFDAAPVP